MVVALQFLGKRLLFAEDRQQTFNDLKMLITDKIAAGQAGEDLKRLAEKVLDAGSAEAVTERAAAAAAPAAAAASPTTESPAKSEGANSSAQAAEWIEAWKSGQASEGGADMNGSAEATETPENVAEAKEWIEKFQKRQA